MTDKEKLLQEAGNFVESWDGPRPSGMTVEQFEATGIPFNLRLSRQFLADNPIDDD